MGEQETQAGASLEAAGMKRAAVPACAQAKLTELADQAEFFGAQGQRPRPGRARLTVKTQGYRFFY